ncbi:MAG: hypothetical protein ABI430_00920 [Candidatus Taylorbacteria bacterium]
MRNFQKGPVNIWLIVIIIILVTTFGYFAFKKKPTTIYRQTTSVPEVTTNPNMSGGKYPGLVVVSPNGGEKIPYGNIVIAGDLGFTWKSQGANYTPTRKFAAYLIDANNAVVRSDFIKVNPLGNGVFASSFVGDAKIQTNKNYKIKVCDEVDTGVTKCDESDNYFTISPQ